MIVVKTNLKKIPTKCSKCKFKINVGSIISPAYMCGALNEMLLSSNNSNLPIVPRKQCPLIEINDNENV